MDNLTSDDYQDAIDLNRKQELAFNALIRSVKRCEKENIYFYQCMETLNALNGNNVERVICDTDHPDGNNSAAPDCLQDKDFPSVNTECSFADDNHFIILKDDCR